MEHAAVISSAAVSKSAESIAIRDSRVAHWILRTSWVYSASGANFLKTMMRLAETKETISVVADQHGAPIDAKRLAVVERVVGSANAPAVRSRG